MCVCARVQFGREMGKGETALELIAEKEKDRRKRRMTVFCQ